MKTMNSIQAAGIAVARQRQPVPGELFRAIELTAGGWTITTRATTTTKLNEEN
jgi:hypothetical protein